MARKKISKSKTNPRYREIKWRKEDVTNLRKAVSQFNKNVRKLNKNRADTDYIPEQLDYKMTKDLIKNRAEFNRVIRSLGRFEGNEAFKKVTLPSGKEITAWEKREIGYQRRSAKRTISRLMEQEKKKYGRKTDYYRELESSFNSLDDIFNRKGVAYKLTRERIKTYGSSDFELRRAIIYKENYLSMLDKRYSELDGYKKLVREVKKMQPIDLYERLKAMEEGEKVKDISFMYDTSSLQHAFILLCNEFGVKTDVEADEDDEEGE